jgi:hypothetical protein
MWPFNEIAGLEKAIDERDARIAELEAALQEIVKYTAEGADVDSVAINQAARKALKIEG